MQGQDQDRDFIQTRSYTYLLHLHIQRYFNKMYEFSVIFDPKKASSAVSPQGQLIFR